MVKASFGVGSRVRWLRQWGQPTSTKARCYEILGLGDGDMIIEYLVSIARHEAWKI